MKISQILFFLLVLLLAQVVSGALTVVLVGAENLDLLAIARYAISFVVATGVFVWMSWTIPGKPYCAAFITGLGVVFLDSIAVIMLAGNKVWDPVVLLADMFSLCLAVFVGVNLGEKIRRINTG